MSGMMMMNPNAGIGAASNPSTRTLQARDLEEMESRTISMGSNSASVAPMSEKMNGGPKDTMETQAFLSGHPLYRHDAVKSVFESDHKYIYMWGVWSLNALMVWVTFVGAIAAADLAYSGLPGVSRIGWNWIIFSVLTSTFIWGVSALVAATINYRHDAGHPKGTDLTKHASKCPRLRFRAGHVWWIIAIWAVVEAFFWVRWSNYHHDESSEDIRWRDLMWATLLGATLTVAKWWRSGWCMFSEYCTAMCCPRAYDF